MLSPLRPPPLLMHLEPKPQTDTPPPRPPVTKPRPHRGFSFFWLVPVLAVALSGYLFWETMDAKGQILEVAFENARDLVAHKTQLRYHGVKVGTVTHVKLNSDFKHVNVTIQLEKNADSLAVKGSQFWIVYPEFSLAGGMSGLDTIINGNYIDMIAGEVGAVPQTEFVGLNRPPSQDPSSADLFLRLAATTMPSVGMDSPIYFRQMKIGKVTDLSYDVQAHQAYVEIRVFKDYKSLVQKETRFWNTSGLDVTVGLSGMTVRSSSLASVIFGSITMGIPDQLVGKSPVVAEGTEFKLFDSLEQVITNEAETINNSEIGIGLVLTLHMPDTQGISLDRTEVRYRGVKVGSVVSVKLAPDSKAVLVKVLLSPRLDNFAHINLSQIRGIAKQGTRFVLVWPKIKIQTFSQIKLPPDIVQGPYLRVEPGEGEECTDFTVTQVEDETYHPMEGLRLMLSARQVGKLTPGSPVYYRGVKVGQTESSGLAADGSSVMIRAIIQDEYAPLVRANTRFWNTSGISTSISLMGGLQVKTESLESVLEGSVAFATPDNATMGGKVKSGTVFELAEKPEEPWLKWQPSIQLDR